MEYMDSPLISVIIPVYNVEKYLRQCLESVIGQTYINLEIILVDDGSTDGSSKICDDFAAIDDRIVVIHQYNAGLSSARNAGLDIMKGDYVSFVDSDDWIEKDMFAILLSSLEDEKADIAISRIIGCVKIVVYLLIIQEKRLFILEKEL